MGFYSEEIIKEVQDRANIVEVISEYTSLQKRGESYVGLCPFHTEKTPSFNVDAEKQLYYCFGCGEGGNVFNFLMKKENLTFPETIRWLADKYFIQLPSSMDQGLSFEFKKRRQFYQLNRLAAKYYNYCLTHTQEGRIAVSYLKRRGITSDTIEKFFLGYAPPSWDSLIRFARSKKIRPEDLENIGLIIPRKDNKGYYDRFRNRIMFPIEDITKNIIGFGGRAIDDSKPKYLNSPETTLFCKGDNLYALSMIEKNPLLDVIIVEGYMDCITLHQHGFKQTVASLGTALTKEQAKLLKKYTDGVILSYDADEAGRAATMRGMDILSEEGIRVKILSLPRGKDPDDVIRLQGADHFKKLLTNSADLISYKLNQVKKEINTQNPDGKIKFIKQAVDILSDIDNEPELEIHLKRLEKELGISAQAIKKEVKGKKLPNNGYGYKKSRTRYNNKEFKKILPVTGFYKAERKLLKLIIENEHIRVKVKDQIEPKYFTNKNTVKIAHIIFEMMSRNKDIEVAYIFNHLNEEECAELTQVLLEPVELEDEELAVALVEKVKEGYLQYSIDEVRKEIKKAEILGQGEEIIDLLNTYQMLKSEIDNLNINSPGKGGA